MEFRKLAIFPACDDGCIIGSGGGEMMTAFRVSSRAGGEKCGGDFCCSQ